jgi:hypothetical protein
MFRPWRSRKKCILQTNCSCRFRHRQREQQHPRHHFHLRRNLARPRTATRAEGSPPRRRTSAPRLGHRSPGLRQGPGPSKHLDWLRSLSQLSPEDLSPAHGLGSMTPRLVPLADDLAKLQPPLLHLLGLGSHLLLGRRSLFSSRLRLCPRRHHCLRLQLIADRPRVLKLSKRGLEWQGRPSRGTPTPPGYGYLTRHLPRKATHTRLSSSTRRQASPSARNEEETRYYAQIPRCSGLDSHNEKTPILRVPLQTELRFHSRGYELPPHQRACGTTNSRWLAGDHCTSSDNDLRFGRLNSSSDDIRADTAVERPSPTSPHEGQGKAIKAEELEVRPQVAPTVSLAEKPSLAATTSAPTTAATCAPALRQRMAAAPACTGRSPLKSSRTGRRRPPRGGVVPE